jgi:hypothetical protein
VCGELCCFVSKIVVNAWDEKLTAEKSREKQRKAEKHP